MKESEHRLPIDWDYLLDTIRDEECLLIVGRDALTDAKGETAHARLLQALDLPNNPHIRRYYPGEGFFLFDHKSHRTQFCHQIKRFYRSEVPGEVLGLLAEIPFHIYMVLNSDLLLSQAFQDRNFAFQHGYYKKNTDPQPIRPPSAENPLLYHLFGCVENEESLVLSHDDLYDYFKSIFARRSMPGELSDELRRVRNLLFLGVPFDKWYLQILLREFELHNEQYAFTRFAANQALSDEVCTLCMEQFQIQFIENNIQDFVRELHRRVAADPHLGLRADAGPRTDMHALVRAHLAGGETETALDALADNLEDSTWQEDVEKLSGRFGRLKKRRLAGILSVDESLRLENEINFDILELLKTIPAQL
ncbi:MAG: SIR2 family protein [Saprospiraceae bacterium]|jgi:hypothetical protein|nr:SIR2 family protein [Saprospiraceae bacterium]